ncbi:hypothetical protein FG379_002702 [Cryptosporidium bovis]|uniref:uncharacterized protein n=1 Tax=Cryptosporidium bovis TaxID=310047 RepID=UPI00351AA3AE|nr:hypothetical protein FG379_002702 [Cryptosporidium bovis]
MRSKNTDNDLSLIKSLLKKNRVKLGENTKKCNSSKHVENKSREYYTCILFLRLDYNDIFGKKMSFCNNINGVNMSNGELYIKKSIELLLSVYRSNYYDDKVNGYNPKIYTLFDYEKYIDNKKLFGDENIIVVKEDNIDIGLHVSLTRNTMLNKRMCIIILKEIINEFQGKVQLLQENNKCVDLDVNKIGFYDNKNMVIKTNIKPFGVYLDVNNIYIYENSNLHTSSHLDEKIRINGGLYSGIKIDNNTRKMYIDPILGRIDDIFIKYGLREYFEYDTCHVTLFYIKKEDLCLKSSLNKGLNIDKEMNLNNFDSSCNIIWIDRMIFRIGINEYTLLFKSL